MTRPYADHADPFAQHDAENSSDEARFALYDGLYTDVPESTYHGLDACSASRLSLLARSPAHAEHARRNPAPSTAAQRIGSAVHRACLQPDTFDAHYVVSEGSSRTKAYKALADEHGADRVLAPDEVEAAQSVAEAVLDHPLAGALLASGGYAEATALWAPDLDVAGVDPAGLAERERGLDPEPHRLRCKARVDYYCPESRALVDLKTTRDASADAFPRSAWQYGYFRQVALYAHALERLGLEVKEVLVVAVEKVPPFGVAVYRVEDEALRAGWRQAEALLGRYAACEAGGVWPGYGEETQALTLPKWAWNQL